MMVPTWPTGTIAYIRDDDGERIGYLIPEEDGWVPHNLLGIAIGEPTDRPQAERLLLEKAMPSIAEPYWCRIPRPLPSDRINARDINSDEWFDRVTVVEIGGDVAILKPLHMYESEQSALITVTLPAHDVLFVTQPEE